MPDRQVSEFYDLSKGEEGSPRRGWIAPGFKLEEVDLRFTERAIHFLGSGPAAGLARPFFIELALSSPHTPWLVPDLVKRKSGDGPRGDLVALADLCVGRVMDALERLGAADRTLVIFASDNGPHPGTDGHASAGTLRGLKSHIWEGGHRVPFIARWPGRIGPGAVVDEPICLTDLMATFAAVAGVALPPEAGPDSVDISSALLKGERGGRVPDAPSGGPRLPFRGRHLRHPSRRLEAHPRQSLVRRLDGPGGDAAGAGDARPAPIIWPRTWPRRATSGPIGRTSSRKPAALLEKYKGRTERPAQRSMTQQGPAPETRSTFPQAVKSPVRTMVLTSRLRLFSSACGTTSTSTPFPKRVAAFSKWPGLCSRVSSARTTFSTE
ncbi:MAG: sulfatase-like hydrolase/transferase [Candidatus Moduliflexus flocculans]|nr:sulfatase-like hydrolase/transferase [Candidatus Moduliflexus flocculans]